jgi:parallel beta-helix repeat protein
MSTYTYSLSSDFGGQINSNQFSEEIIDDVTIITALDYITTNDDDVDIVFVSTLSGPEVTQLNSLVAAYVYIEIKEPKSTAFNTVVSSSNGDYTSIADAFSNGALAVHLKNGVYYEFADIVIPNGGQLHGELPGQTIVVFPTGKTIRIDGSGGIKETSGTISITNNTAIVTGVGTTFTNLSVGDFILLGTNYYEILTIDSDTQVTLKETYLGKTLSAETYKAQTMHTGSSISNMIVTASTGPGVYIRGLRHGNLKSIAITKCSPCVEIVDSGDLSINECISTYSNGIGFNVIDSVSISLHTVNVFNSSSHGFEFSGKNIIAESCASENNNGCGIHIQAGSEFVNISNTVVKYNNADGITSNTGAMCSSISNCEISNNNGIGIDIQSNNNNISNNYIIKNNIGAIVGSHTIIEGNMINNNTGDGVKLPVGSDYCNISDNNMKNNGGIGINVLSNRSGLGDNTIIGSTGDGIYINGTKNRISGNTVANNSGKGIHILGTGDGNIISNNIVDMNVGNGIEIITGAENTIVIANNCQGNTGTNYIDNGTSTIAANNITA